MDSRKVGSYAVGLLTVGMLCIPINAFADPPVYEILCPPHGEEITVKDSLRDEPLRKNLKNGRVFRIRDEVKRAIAQLACDNQKTIETLQGETPPPSSIPES